MSNPTNPNQENEMKIINTRTSTFGTEKMREKKRKKGNNN